MWVVRWYQKDGICFPVPDNGPANFHDFTLEGVTLMVHDLITAVLLSWSTLVRIYDMMSIGMLLSIGNHVACTLYKSPCYYLQFFMVGKK